MLYRVLDKKDYKDFVSGLIAGYKVIGPKKETKQFMILQL